MDNATSDDLRHMRQALRLAALGQGLVEPNPMVGCVIAQSDRVVGEGWHERFGGPHAEVNALRSAGSAAAGATLYVTLEPCCHHGKTPPCTDAVIRAGINRVVIAQLDPYGKVQGQGIRRLREAGLQVEIGLLEPAARRLNAPYLKLLRQRRPWVIAKWAMTLDGKIATHRGHSQWISSAASRKIVHSLRGRVDVIVVGSQTALADDPLLTARPSGSRTAARVVVDSTASLPVSSQLVRTAYAAPVIVAVSETACVDRCDQLRERGCEILVCAGAHHLDRLNFLLDELGKRGWTNVLAEGGGGLLGNLLQLGEIDEVHAFIAPKLIGGTDATSPIEGLGFASIDEALVLDQLNVQQIGDDIYVTGTVLRTAPESTETP